MIKESLIHSEFFSHKGTEQQRASLSRIAQTHGRSQCRPEGLFIWSVCTLTSWEWTVLKTSTVSTMAHIQGRYAVAKSSKHRIGAKDGRAKRNILGLYFPPPFYLHWFFREVWEWQIVLGILSWQEAGRFVTEQGISNRVHFRFVINQQGWGWTSRSNRMWVWFTVLVYSRSGLTCNVI